MLIRIATRRSRLALAQSEWVCRRLEALDPSIRTELREYVTQGDRVQDLPLSRIGGKGLFTKEIEEALLAEEADLAVHSLKDLPSELPPGLTLAAVPQREDPRDAVVLPAGSGAAGDWSAALPRSARVGTSSLRRSAQLRAARTDLRIDVVRGNVDTRLRKLDEGGFDALVLASAGLRRLGLEERIAVAIPEGICTPAPGQGALGLECRAADSGLLALLDRIADESARIEVSAERAVMTALGGGCSVPLGARARVEGDRISLIAVVAAPDGSRVLRQRSEGFARDAEALGREAAAALLRSGAGELIRGTAP